MDPMVRGEIEALRQWESVEPVGVDYYKLIVWICAAATPWLAIATVAVIAFRSFA